MAAASWPDVVVTLNCGVLPFVVQPDAKRLATRAEIVRVRNTQLQPHRERLGSIADVLRFGEIVIQPRADKGRLNPTPHSTPGMS
jgi:hypothetical protein